MPSFLDHVGHTPLVAIDGVFVKLECSNPGGSVKDRVAKYMLTEAARRGELRPGDTVVETTSGNTGIALTLVAREMGYKVLIFMPEHMSVERRRMLQHLGAEVCLTPKEEGFEGAVRRRDEYRGRPGHYVPDQFGNPDNTRCHQETTGREILAQLAHHGNDRPDAFVAGVGTGGTLMGVGAALKAAWPDLKVVAVEPDEAAVMSGDETLGDHGIMGIGDGFIPDLVDMKDVDAVERVPTDEAHAEAERILKVHGYCVGRSAGANMVVAKRLRDRGFRVVTVWPDCSDRYVSLGLEPPTSRDVACPLQATCAERSKRMLGE